MTNHRPFRHPRAGSHLFGCLVFFFALVTALPSPAAPEPGRVRLLVMDLAAAEDQQAQSQAVLEAFTAALAEEPYFNVVSGENIRRMLDIEAQKALLGCDSQTCLSEIAGALDARWIITGSYRPLGPGKGIRIQFDFNDTREVTVLRRVHFLAENLADAVRLSPNAAARLAVAYEEAMDIFSLRHVNLWPWALAGTGVVSFGGGITAAVFAYSLFDQQRDATQRLNDIEGTENGVDGPTEAEVEETRTAALTARDDYQVFGIPLIITAAITGVAGFALGVWGLTWLFQGDGMEVE
jgi:hypothetical protein